MGFVFTLAQDKKVEASFFMKIVEQSIWIGIGACALLGLFCGYLLFRRIKQKSFPGVEAEQAFLNDVGECLDRNDFDGALALCDTPELVESRTAAIDDAGCAAAGSFDRENSPNADGAI